jgi:hypothetical protein
MFAFHRSALAVLAPLALLLAVVWLSSRSPSAAADPPQQALEQPPAETQTVAANLSSR